MTMPSVARMERSRLTLKRAHRDENAVPECHDLRLRGSSGRSPLARLGFVTGFLHLRSHCRTSHGSCAACVRACTGRLCRQLHGRRRARRRRFHARPRGPEQGQPGLPQPRLWRIWTSPPSSTLLITAPRGRRRPLLLARETLTVILRRRVEGAQRLVEEGADIIIMDDGFQSARRLRSRSALVATWTRCAASAMAISCRAGSGAGPDPPAVAIRNRAARLSGRATPPTRSFAWPHALRKPFFGATLKPTRQDDLKGKRVLAFAGIADPGKFFRTVEELEAEIVARRPWRPPASDR